MNRTKIVNVRNRLGASFENRDIQVTTWVDDQNLNNVILPNGEEGVVFPGDPLTSAASAQLEKIIIEVLGWDSTDPIPVSVDSPETYSVTVSQLEPGKFQLLFKPPLTPSRDGDTTSNVTVGSNEPKFAPAPLILGGLTIGLVVGPVLFSISPILLGAAAGASAALCVFTWFKRCPGKTKR